ncbi:MAG: DegT/DnrJ/EryC1/StrS family aminotransferase [Thermodesulfobacteriota bacterium]|nr:DegT/DnrJ/EryC1/StrS family aminotransferase [Thermodesulfobacteriota bacterium]
MTRPDAFADALYVTRPALPDRKAVYRKIDEIWDSRWLTNIGEQHRHFESGLRQYLGVDNATLFCNGTIALQLACQSMRLSGEVITTPFTFAATTHVLYWNNLKPVFCDIDPYTFNIDPKQIESLISPYTTAILPVHVFGYPCDTEAIQEIADRYGIHVIYDAAHCFGVEMNGKQIGNFGDVSMFSFHATKVFHTIEGGALTYKDSRLKERLELAKNFGFIGEESIVVPGINGKMNELQAAIGLLMLDIVEDEIDKRRRLTQVYRERLKEIPGIGFRDDIQGVKHNYYNFVITVDKDTFGADRDVLYDRLKEFNVFSRKYFWPLCSQLQCYRLLPSASSENLTVAEKITTMVLSLPLYGELSEDDIHRICDIIEYIQKRFG